MTTSLLPGNLKLFIYNSYKYIYVSIKHVFCILKFQRGCLQKAFSNLSLIVTEVIELFLLKNKLLGKPQK